MQSELLKILEAKGCAIEAILCETFVGKESFYERMLQKFPANTSISRLGAAAAAGEPRAVFDVAHELKGMYSTLGLSPLLSLCVKIVETTRGGSMDGVKEDVARLEAMHAEFIGIITAHAPAGSRAEGFNA